VKFEARTTTSPRAASEFTFGTNNENEIVFVPAKAKDGVSVYWSLYGQENQIN
jgi:hypothetical protein